MKNSPQKEEQYTKISDFNVGFEFDKDAFQCYIANDKKTNKKVIIKSYKNDFFAKNSVVLSEEIGLLKAFNGNQNILKLLNICNEKDRINLVFEYMDCEMLLNYIQKNNIKEKEIKRINKTLYDNVFVFNECNFLPFIFISVYSFCIDKKGNPIIFDFGSHKLFLKKEEYSSYFLSNESELNNYNKNPIKTNILNYGITLLKFVCRDKLEIKGKELVLPENIILSNDFNDFISKCIYRNIDKRNSWLQLGENKFIYDDSVQMSNIVGKEALLDNDKLGIIFDSLKNKFETIINYYSKFDFKKQIEYIQQIEAFVVITNFEAKIIYHLFNRNIYEKPFTKQNEISFITINDNCQINKFNLNLLNPLLKDTIIIHMTNNKLIKEFLPTLKKYIQKLEKLSSKIHRNTKDSLIKGTFQQFLQVLLNNFENSKIQEYFFSIIKKADNEQKNSQAYSELCLAEYLCEFILFVKTVLYEQEEQIPFDKKIYIKKFCEIFGEEKNKIEISVLNIKEEKKAYILVSFLAILFKCYRGTDKIDNQLLEKNKQGINGLVRFYPNLMKKIVEKKSLC
jgi:hypothetical protein